MIGKYDDIINLPHHVSKTRPQMSRWARAAQFAPFAAITGLDDELEETARLTDSKRELSESEKDQINKILIEINNSSHKDIPVKITHFVKDGQKDGGAYLTGRFTVKKIDEIYKKIIFTDRTEIEIENIMSLSIVK